MRASPAPSSDPTWTAKPSHHSDWVNRRHAELTTPQRPIRRELTDLPAFLVNRGGEYCFIPGLRGCAGSGRSTPEPISSAAARR